VRAEGWALPLDLASRGSANLGGVVSTAAGGARLVRSGPLAGALLGVEMVDGTGRILRFGSRLRKDNVGLHLHLLALGAEGMLGVVTAVTIAMTPRAESAAGGGSALGVLRCGDWSGLRRAVRIARREVGEALAAVE
jgi:FAD/FMN-containing dehydrogenase